MEISGLENTSALIKNNHEGRGVRRQRKSLRLFRDVYGVELRAGRGGNFNVDRNLKNAHVAFDPLRLLDAQRDLVRGIIVGVADFELRSPRAINPLVEEALHINMIGFFHGSD